MLTPLAYEGRRGLFVWKYLLKYVIYNREGKNSQMKDDRVEITDMGRKNIHEQGDILKNRYLISGVLGEGGFAKSKTSYG